MKVFETKQQATEYAINTYGKTQVETETVNVVKVGGMIAKFYGCSEGYAVDKEMN